MPFNCAAVIANSTSIYDAYENAVSNNKLFDWEQTKFLKKNYENKSFNMPFKKTDDRGEC